MNDTPAPTQEAVEKAVIVKKSPEIIEQLRKNLRAVEAEFNSGQFMSEKALDGVINEAIRLGRTQDTEWVNNHARAQIANTHRQMMAKKNTKLSEGTKKRFSDRVREIVHDFSKGTVLLSDADIDSVLSMAINSRKIGGSSWDERWLESLVQRRTDKKMKQAKSKKASEPIEQKSPAPKLKPKAPSHDFPQQNAKEAIGSTVSIKFSGMPETTKKDGVTRFVLLSGGIEFDVLLEKKVWAAAAAEMLDYDDWVATAKGDFGEPTPRGFILKDPTIKVVEI